MCTHLALLRCHITIHAAAFTDLRSTIYAADAIALTCSIHSFMAPYSRHHMHCHAPAFTLHLCSPVHTVARAFFCSSDGAALMPSLSRNSIYRIYAAPHTPSHFGRSIHAPISRGRILAVAFTVCSPLKPYDAALALPLCMWTRTIQSATANAEHAAGGRQQGRGAGAGLCVYVCLCVCGGGGCFFRLLGVREGAVFEKRCFVCVGRGEVMYVHIPERGV